MKKDYNPRLTLRKDKKRKTNGKMPVYVLFSYPRKKEMKFALGYSFSDEEWSKIENLPNDSIQREVIVTELNRIKKEVAICSIKGLTVTRETLREIVKNEFASDPLEKDFLEFFEKFIERKRTMVRQNTYDSYKQTLNALIEFKNGRRYRRPIKLRDINIELVKDFIEFLEHRAKNRGYKIVNSSFPNHTHKIQECIRVLMEEGYPIKNPFGHFGIKIKPPKRNKVYLLPKEILKYRAWSFKQTLPLKEKMVILMLLLSCCTGLRISDIINLKWGNILISDELENGVIKVKCKKTAKMVYIPASNMLRDILVSLFPHKPYVASSQKLFPLRYSQTTWLKILRKVTTDLNIGKEITFHAGRRTFTTLCYRFKIEEGTIKRMLGHSIGNTTERYRQWDAYEVSNPTYYLDGFDFKTLVRQN